MPLNQLLKEQSKHLVGADGLRALACMGVIFHHLSQNLDMHRQSTVVQEIQSFMLMGNIGVSIFFVLSGYLLAFPFWKQYLNDGDYPSIKQYAIRRAARIMPGYYIAFVVCMILVLSLNIPAQYFWLRSLTGLTFTSGFHYITFFPAEINGPLWSISFEVFSYLLMPLFMYGLFRIFRQKRSFPAALLYWVGVLLLVCLINLWIHYAFTPNDELRGWQYGLIGGAKYWMPNYNPIGMFGHFAIGILASGVVCRMQKYERIAKLRQTSLFDLLSVCSLIAAALFIWLARHLPEFSWSIQGQPFYFPLFTLILGCFLITASFSVWFGKAVDNPFFRYTAKVSFGLYIWHSVLITLISMYWIKDFRYMGIAQLDRWIWISLGIIVVSYAIASLSYFAIEKPILDRTHRRRGSIRHKKDKEITAA